MRTSIWCGAAIVALALGAGGDARAVPLLAVDADPSQPGLQDVRIVSVGSSFDVFVTISNVEAAHPLHAFELSLGYDALVLAATDADLGAFLVAPVLVVENDATPPAVRFAATTLGPLARDGAGELLSIHFDAIALGTSILSLASVILAEPFGDEIVPFELLGATIQVVPEPATGVLLVMGLGAIASRPRRA